MSIGINFGPFIFEFRFMLDSPHGWMTTSVWSCGPLTVYRVRGE